MCVCASTHSTPPFNKPSYAGPFNQDFRRLLSKELFPQDLADRGVPVTSGIDLTAFLVDRVVVGDWNSEGLPTDPLSIQNGIMVTRSTRYPLLIDPQGQGLKWVLARENRRREAAGRPDKLKPVSLQHPRLQHVLEQALGEGDAMVIAGVEQELDPLLDPVLEKQVGVQVVVVCGMACVCVWRGCVAWCCCVFWGGLLLLLFCFVVLCCVVLCCLRLGCVCVWPH